MKKISSFKKKKDEEDMVSTTRQRNEDFLPEM
jgi:hypothetical protein